MQCSQEKCSQEIVSFVRSLFTTRWGALGLCYVVVVYMTLPIMRLLSNGLIEMVGVQNFQIMINLTMAGVGCALFWIGLKLKKLRSVSIMVPLIIAIIATWSLDRPIERIHFIEYGTLSLMILTAVRRRTIWQLVLTFIFVVLVGIGDELIQWWLPNRVGDVRDVMLNAIGGALGIWFGKLLVWD